MVVLNSRDRHKKHGVPLLRASIIRLTIYFTQKNQLKWISNTITTLNATKIRLMRFIENFKIFCWPAVRLTRTRIMASDFSYNEGNRV